MTVAKRNICGDLKPGFNFSKVKKKPTTEEELWAMDHRGN